MRFLKLKNILLYPKSYIITIVLLAMYIILLSHISFNQQYMRKKKDDIYWSQIKLASLYGQEGQDEDAIKIYRELIERYPQKPAPYTLLSKAYVNEGNYEEALKVYNTRNSEFALFLSKYSLHLYLIFMDKSSLNDLLNNFDRNIQCSKVHKHQKEFDKALMYLKDANKYSVYEQERLLVNYHRADIYIQKGEIEKACRELIIIPKHYKVFFDETENMENKLTEMEQNLECEILHETK